MDPNTVLHEQLEIAHRITRTGTDEGNYPYDQDRLAELVLALDDWISQGGSLPNRWKEEQ